MFARLGSFESGEWDDILCKPRRACRYCGECLPNGLLPPPSHTHIWMSLCHPSSDVPTASPSRQLTHPRTMTHQDIAPIYLADPNAVDGAYTRRRPLGSGSSIAPLPADNPGITSAPQSATDRVAQGTPPDKTNSDGSSASAVSSSDEGDGGVGETQAEAHSRPSRTRIQGPTRSEDM